MDTRAAMEPSPGVLASTALASVDIVIPVLNEERALPGCVRTLARYLEAGFPLPWRITIVDNGSTDATWPLATALAGELPHVYARRLEIRGRGAALRAAWQDSPADVVAYMDVDLSTDLGALFPLVAAVAGGHSEIAVGTRLAPGARTRRSLRREVVSRGYNALLRHGFGVRFSDAQCGFKAARADVVRPLLRKVGDDSWFFDTELLLLAEHNGLRVHEVPVDWIEDGDSRVRVVRTAVDDLKGLARVAWTMGTGRARVRVRRAEPAPAHPDAVLTHPISDISALIGLIPGITHALAYFTLREMWSPVTTNLGALFLAAFVNVTARRRSAFHTAARFALLYALTTAAVLGVPAGGAVPESGAVAATYCLLALLRWVFTRTRN
ncbi:glycosyl transferase, family 2 [[Actinomadura] parvosata subsp. kistnae]|uniref:Glycosyl transferase family 2 n=1 Tax=[Actinomadura] parvosata subsp. kistnae TaxID=1909395 RepID=A0A1V0A9H6_9ACTN|nr:glycosyltransferase [Nonomuraea sp. ATCC 55076]AQZ66829.1 glycosyl transferase family 2 [Nonomuraea sp. ATCC 55076]SPL95031.1 glycosyl transferase, family 2 [Actinomadura parvosata subsp. kistnae]